MRIVGRLAHWKYCSLGAGESTCGRNSIRTHWNDFSAFWKGRRGVFGLGPATRIYLAVGWTDLRKGFEGLHGLVRDRLGLEPLSGHVVLFCNRCRNRVKGLFSWPGGDEQSTRVTLTHEELSLLLGGIELARTRRKNWYRKEVELGEKI